MAEQIWKVAIVGGGITGLSAAYHLQEHAVKNGLSLELTVIEASHRLGGKIQSLEKDGYIIDRGADSFFEGHENIADLADELGIGDQLVRNQKDEVCVIIEEDWYPVPVDTVLGVPTKMFPFFTSNILSWSGKIRAAADLILPKSKTEGDQPLGEFIRSRFGKEMAENLVEPLVADITASDLNRLSLQATFPEFMESQQHHNSLIRGMKQHQQELAAPQGQGERSGTFFTFKKGLETLVTALEAKLDTVRFLKNVKVLGVERARSGMTLHLNNETSLTADHVIFAVPHEKLLPLFEPHGLMKNLKEMPSTSVATLFMGFDEAQMDIPEIGTDFIVSRNSDLAISSCTWMHRKWSSTAPAGKLLLRATIGRAGDEAVVDLPDHELESLVMEDMKRRLRIEGNPEFTLVTRWKEGMPQYTVGHRERIEKVRADLARQFPMAHLAGSSFDGHRIAHCITQGKSAAATVVEQLLNDQSLEEAQ